MTDDAIIDGILEHEGGYVDHPDDRGGPTKFGITRGTLSESRGAPVDATDVEHLTVEEARTIYRQRYISRPGFDRVGDGRLRAVLVDWGVLSGPATAIKGLQRCLAVPADGVLGPLTLLALPHLEAEKVYRRVLGQRLRFFGRLITDNPSQAVFAAGWLNRCADFLEAG